LTDETARANWEKYGNPDGPGAFHVAIALPRFLLEKENNVMVLCIFFAVLLVVIPTLFYFNLD
jgi:translocation protein SEC63